MEDCEEKQSKKKGRQSKEEIYIRTSTNQFWSVQISCEA
jgi:hypothetical protein